MTIFAFDPFVILFFLFFSFYFSDRDRRGYFYFLADGEDKKIAHALQLDEWCPSKLEKKKIESLRSCEENFEVRKWAIFFSIFFNIYIKKITHECLIWIYRYIYIIYMWFFCASYFVIFRQWREWAMTRTARMMSDQPDELNYLTHYLFCISN